MSGQGGIDGSSAERYSSTWFEAVLDAMQELVLVKGPRSELLWANRAMRDFYGLDNEALAASASAAAVIDSDASDPSDTVQYVRDDRQVFVSGEALEVTEPATLPDGSVNFVRTRKTVMCVADGRAVGTVGVSTQLDRSDVQAAQERKKRHEDLSGLQLLVDHLPAAVVMVDAQRRLIACSRIWEETFEGTHARGSELRVPGALGVEALIERTMRDGEPVTVEDQPSGLGDMRMDLHVHPFWLPDGRLGGSMVLATDVTELRRQERSLRALNEELARLTYRASHDLVAPLRTALGWIQLIREDVENGDMEQVLDSVRRAESGLEKLSDRVRELSDLALADASSEEPVWVELRSLIDAVFDSASVEHVVFENAVPAGRSVFVPTTRLRSVLERLVDNGVRFAEGGAGAPQSLVRVEMADGDDTCLQVVDNGIGMPEEGVDVFEMFVRGSAGRGTHGLGLHVARKHMRRMNGDLSVDADAAHTTLVVHLPKEVWR